MLKLIKIFVFLLLFHVAGKGSINYVSCSSPDTPESILSAIYSGPLETGSIRSSYNLQAPDAIVVPATSFQFGFVESFCFLVLAFFFFCKTVKVWEVTPPFTYTYFKKLFSSLILINAP